VSSPEPQIVQHALSCAAPASLLYDLVADVTRWPTIMPPFVHVEHLERSETDELFRVWGLIGDQVRTWVSRRHHDAERQRITFEQESNDGSFAYMAGQWEFEQLDGESRVTLEHRFAVNGDSAERDRTVAGVDNNSMRDLAALCQLSAFGYAIDELVFSFSDQVRLPVGTAEAYSFVERCDLWPDELPYVGRVALNEPRPGVQFTEMDTVTADGYAHTTQSVRLCFPSHSIVYKQLIPPSLLVGHSGSWEFSADGDGTLAVGRHTVAINPSVVGSVLGAECTLAAARESLRAALGANSRATLSQAGVLVAAESRPGQ
jgi:aromatase